MIYQQDQLTNHEIENNRVIEVAMGGLAVAEDRKTLLKTFVGSCIAICIYDQKNTISAMAHVMLPKNAGIKTHDLKNQGKFADEAILTILEQIKNKRGNIGNLKAKISGGAKIFSTEGDSNVFDIGKRNIEAIRSILSEMGIQIVSEDVGGRTGRWVVFDCSTEELQINPNRNGGHTI